MFSRNRGTHHESGTTKAGIRPVVHCVLAVFLPTQSMTRQDFQRNHQPAEAGRGINISGVDFWHAVEFSRNGRFLCTHPQNILWGFPPGASLRSFVSDSRSKRVKRISLSSSSLSRFPFRRTRLYQTFSLSLTGPPQTCGCPI